MVRRVRAYTAIGDRISTLGRRQREIASVLGVSQQTVSKKLRGETAILLSDLEKLGAHYKVPLTYFFEEDPGGPELVIAWEKIRAQPGALQDLVVLLTRLSPGDVQRVLEIARVVGGPGEAGPATTGARPARGAPGSGRAAEGGSPYGAS
jgi:transcriptional regulator with XRE-family HTH domain